MWHTFNSYMLPCEVRRYWKRILADRPYLSSGTWITVTLATWKRGDRIMVFHSFVFFICWGLFHCLESLSLSLEQFCDGIIQIHLHVQYKCTFLNISECLMDSQCCMCPWLLAQPVSAQPLEGNVPSATVQNLWSPGQLESVCGAPHGLQCQYWEGVVKEPNTRS